LQAGSEYRKSITPDLLFLIYNTNSLGQKLERRIYDGQPLQLLYDLSFAVEDLLGNTLYGFGGFSVRMCSKELENVTEVEHIKALFIGTVINSVLVDNRFRSGTGKEVFPRRNHIQIAASTCSSYHIDKLAMAGGSAGHALAMIYAYRDAAEAPVPLVFTFGSVGPSCFYKNDWDNYGFDQETEEAYQGCAGIFSAMLGEVITVDELKDGSYVEKMRPISAADWITPDSPPTVVAYGTHDRIQPFKSSLRLKAALEENEVDHVYLELPHSGHGLQNDNAIQKQWIGNPCSDGNTGSCNCNGITALIDP
jgi:hypothetical protein